MPNHQRCASPLPVARKQNDHPSGLHTLCFSVGLERFGFFLVSSILVLYLNEHARLTTTSAVQTLGCFLCATYLTTLLGGRLCDGQLGRRQTALWGCGLQTAGYLLLLVDGPFGLFSALVLLALGSGLFKAGTQTLIASLYIESDPRRDRGFSRLYLVINVGALVAPLLAGLLHRHAGWAYIFVLASLCTALSWLSLFLACRWLVAGKSVLPPSVLHYTAAKEQQTHQRLAWILLAGIVFTVGSMQSHSTLLLWVRDRTERHLASFEVPVAWFAAAPAALVLVVTPLMSALFAALRRRKREPSTFHKILLGLLMTWFAAVPMWAASLLALGGQRTSAWWVLLCLTILALSEMLVIALAPSEISRLAPREKQGRWLSYWFVAQAVGNMVGGLVRF